jgi:hypothetical protein
VTIVLRHNENLELNRVDYSGSVTLAELHALARFSAGDSISLKHDTLSLVGNGTDFASISFEELDALFNHYSALFSGMSFHILRRSAWINQSPAAQAHVDRWLGDRDYRQEMSSDVRQFAAFKEAGDWLVLGPAALAALESGEGFTEIVRFHQPVEAQRTMAR